MPVSTPVVAEIVAIAVLLQLHVPPAIALVSVTAVPMQTEEGPTIGDDGLTATVLVAVSINPQASVTISV